MAKGQLAQLKENEPEFHDDIDSIFSSVENRNDAREDVSKKEQMEYDALKLMD